MDRGGLMTQEATTFELARPSHGRCTISFPGLLIPAFVACSTNAGEGLVNSSRAVTYMDIGWTCGGVAHYPECH